MSVAPDDAMTVLIVEDEPMIMMDLTYTLGDEGARVLQACDVEGALAAIEADHPMAAVLDVDLGGGATCEPVARALRAMQVPFILHSGDLDRQGGLIATLGANVVPKPTPPDIVARQTLELVR